MMSNVLAKLLSLALPITACMLVLSFSVHSLQIEHVHPGGDTHAQGKTEVLGEYMHAAEKKLFFYAVLSFLLLGAFLVPGTKSGQELMLSLRTILVRVYRSRVFFGLRLFSHFRILLKRGILNPKLF